MKANRLVVFVILFCIVPISAYPLTTIREIIKPEHYTEGISESYLNEKIREIVVNYIRNQPIDEKLKNEYIDAYSNYIIGYTIRKIEDREGEFLLKVNLNFGAGESEGKKGKISVIARSLKTYNDLRKISAVIEDFKGGIVFPSYVGMDECRWDFLSEFGADELKLRGTAYLNDFEVIVSGDNPREVLVIPRDKP